MLNCKEAAIAVSIILDKIIFELRSYGIVNEKILFRS